MYALAELAGDGIKGGEVARDACADLLKIRLLAGPDAGEGAGGIGGGLYIRKLVRVIEAAGDLHVVAVGELLHVKTDLRAVNGYRRTRAAVGYGEMHIRSRQIRLAVLIEGHIRVADGMTDQQSRRKAEQLIIIEAVAGDLRLPPGRQERGVSLDGGIFGCIEKGVDDLHDDRIVRSCKGSL